MLLRNWACDAEGRLMARWTNRTDEICENELDSGGAA